MQNIFYAAIHWCVLLTKHDGSDLKAKSVNVNEIISAKTKKIKSVQKAALLIFNNQNHCGELNIHFSNIGKNISSKINTSPTTFDDFLNESFTNLCSFPLTKYQL